MTEPPDATGSDRSGRDHIRFGRFGLVRVFDGEESLLVSDPIEEAFDDGRGGVVYGIWNLEGWWDLFWLRAGSDVAEELSIDAGHWSLTVLDGHPTLVLREYWNEEWTGECADYEVGAILHDLDSGEERMLTCRLPMEDGSLFPESQGGGWFVGALSVSSGASGTSVRLVFWDQSGAELVVQTNPFPESCAPCNIGALISPDGTRLAYYYRPDAKWPPQEWDAVPQEEWWEHSKHIPAEIIVIDLQSGLRLFEMDIGASDGGIADFDGRYLVIELWEAGEATSTIIDITVQAAPTHHEGRVRLVRHAT